MQHKSGNSRKQAVIIRSLDEMVSKDNSARLIDTIVDNMDTSYFVNARTKNTGRPPYNPKDMLKLYIYGMENGIMSSRKLERECKRNIEVMWLINELTPESKTICNFRRDNVENISRFFTEFCLNLKNQGYIDGKIMAIDGTKIRANNSKRNNFSAKKLDRHIAYIDEKIVSYLSDVEKNDKIEELQERKAKYENYKIRIKEENISEISTIDPDARLMSSNNNGVDVSYNIQSVVDAKNKLIAGMSVTTSAADAGQLAKVMPKVKQALNLDKITVLADKGYYKTEDFKICEDNNITTIVAKNEPAKQEIYSIDNFTYDLEADIYICPNNEKMFPGKLDKKGYREYKNYRACRNCPQKDYCTKGNRRVIKRHKDKSSAEENDRRLKENSVLYKQRQMLVEHPFGTIKRTMGIRQFLTRGKRSVKAEVALIFLCYNLKRLRKIWQDGKKKAGINSFLSSLLTIFLQLPQNLMSYCKNKSFYANIY